YQNSQDGIRHNTDYGYLRGKLTSSYNFAYNEYHKPQISLSHYWTIDEKSSLTTSAYLSLASGGGQKVYGLNTYKKADGTTDFDAAITANAGGAAKNYLTMSVNDHDWYGLISNYNRSLGKNLKFTGGIDLRCYKGYHYEEISDLLGGSFLQPYAPLGYQTKESELHVGDKINSDYVSHIAQLGAFAELAYTTEHLNAFVSLAAMNHSFQREDFSTNTKANHKYYVPTTTKVGVNYQFANLHRVFVNAGYITRAPQMDNIYDGNRLVSDPILEKAWTMEGGYGIQMEQFMATMSAYYTRWDDKSTTTFLGANKTEKACIPNIDAIHQGIELEVNYRPTHTLKVGGFVSVGNWKWANNVTYQKYDNYNHLLGEGKANLKGVHVGDAPQTSVNLNAEWELMKDFHIAADFFYYARHYANFYPDARTDGQDSWQLPDYGLVDLRANYAFKLGGVKALLYGNVNNLFDKENIAEAFDGAAHTRQDATVWYGFGRTWSVGLRFQF
ncbi:MAG: TonB-dependent receptor, partial [Bacteroidaceae bacterium]